MKSSQDAKTKAVVGDDQRRPHVLAIPFPFMGHMIPLLQLCRMLIATTGCRVTIACTERAVPSLRKLLPAKELKDDQFSMEVLPIPDGLPLELDATMSWDSHRDLLRLYNEGYARSLQPHMSSFADVACVISDVYWSWTQEVADQLGVPRIAIWVAAAAEFQVYFHAEELIKAGKLPFKAPPGMQTGVDNMIPNMQGRPPAYHRAEAICNETEENIAIPGLPILNRRDFPTLLQIEDPTDELFSFFFKHSRGASQASMVLFNSFEALEGVVLDQLRSQGVCARTIGPLFLLEDVILQNVATTTNDKSVGTSPMKENGGEDHAECLKWLDRQKPKSVIYVAFGTTIDVERAQLRELVFGLLNSGQPFIWAYSGASVASELSEGLLEQVKDTGLFLKWAPQKLILGHRAIGAFLTHCGWNSTLESMTFGVPTLALPFVTDQTLHCKLMVDAWQVGLRLERSPTKGIVLTDDIASLTRELITSEKGATLRTKAQNYQIAAQSSIQPGGSSHQTLEAIIKLVLNKK